MRLRFTDVIVVKRQAKRTVEGDSFDITRWWSKKYNRPPNDPLFLERPEACWVREMYEDVYDRKVEIEGLLEDETLKFDERRMYSQKLRAIYKALGEQDVTMGEDPLADKWERELAAGITPNLDEQQ